LTLRDVRQAINEFRDSSWAALVRTRNHLLGTITITGIVTYLLLTVAISGRGADAPANLTTDAFAAAATLYLIGAVVGLFNRLYAESSSDNSIEDYGLTVARTGLTPVLSGLAALGGVLIIAILPAALSGDILAPTTTVVTQAPGGAASGQPAAQVVKRTAPSLDNVFNLSANPLSIVLAAVFGLTPSLLIGALQNAGDRYRAAVQSTSASTQSH